MSKKFCVIASNGPVTAYRRTFFANIEESIEYAKTLVRRSLQKEPNKPVELYVVEVVKVVGTVVPEIQVRSPAEVYGDVLTSILDTKPRRDDRDLDLSPPHDDHDIEPGDPRAYK